MDFLAEYFKVVDKNISNDHSDNWDFYRFGPESRSKQSLRGRAATSFINYLHKKGYFHINSFINNDLANVLKFKYLFENLETKENKDLLLQVLAYRILGHRKIKLPLNTPDYWSKIKEIEKLSDKSDSMDVDFMNITLHKFDVTPLGYPIKFYFSSLGVNIDFVIKQYEFKNNNTFIKAEKGDIVIDAGGCWGDTALYFANEVDDSGKVYSFEFIPKNITLFEKNISFNKELEDRIELVKHPVWKDSATKIYFKDNGPGSKVTMKPFEEQDGDCFTLSIDDFVSQKGLNKLDFIKMDIEGAETDALKGAENVIKKFKPKLAIALYHSFDDFEKIPKLIREIVPGYKFYFSHCTIFGEESMLFAKAD